MSATIQLDKQFTTEAGETHGTISIRVIVLKPKGKDDKDKDGEDDEPAVSAEPDDDFDDGSGKANSPLASYMEKTPEKRSPGKMCVVFTVNGQRHHYWDKNFIARDLGFKYLRDRTMIVVDLDGLATHAMAEIIQGSRQGLFESKVYFAIRDRIIQTLKSDPALKKLQLEAEQKVLEMEAGDEAVKNKLDQLIEGHHALAHSDGPGIDGAGPQASDAAQFGDGAANQDVVVMGRRTVGETGELPVLVTDPRIAAVRLHPGEPKTVVLTSYPREEWANLADLRVQLANPVEGLSVTEARGEIGSTLIVSFDEAEELDDDEYPEGEIQAFGRFKDRPETRMLKLPVVVIKKREKKERVPIELLEEPTKLKVKSRQPVRLTPGGPSVHVKLEWNGQERLLRGSNPRWKFQARCVTLGTFPSIGFASMADGRLELILYPPHGLLTNTELEFEAVAVGPDDKRLQATFKAVVVPPPTPAPGTNGPRKISTDAPQTAGQRRPPYKPVLIYEKDWDNPDCTRWGGDDWTADDAGRFIDPTDTQPLLLVINMDMGLLKAYREGMVKRKTPLEEKTISERMNHYIAHVAFHLYQMFFENRQKLMNPPPGEEPHQQADEDLQEEVNRVGKTLIRLMEVTAR